MQDGPCAPPGGGRKADASAVPPQAKYKAREAALKAQSERKPGKLPESPKRAEEIWQQSVIGDYLARFKNDREKALKAMEMTWNNMEKKEKLM